MRHHERDRFETVFEESAYQVLESFQDALEQSLLSLDAMSVSITSFATAMNLTFPFVTMPDFDVRGANMRIQSGSHVLCYLPIITNEKRAAWEDYAMQHRFHADVAFAREDYFRKQQDVAYGRSLTSITTTATDKLSPSDHNSHPNATVRTRQLDKEETKLQQNVNAPTAAAAAAIAAPPPLNLTILEDGTGYHSKIWRQAPGFPLGDEPDGTGPFLPVWQKRYVTKKPYIAGKIMLDEI